MAKKQSLAEYEQARQAHILAVQFEDEMRVREFQIEKNIEQQVRSDEWDRKTKEIKERGAKQEAVTLAKKRAQLEKYGEKIENLEKKKVEEVEKMQLRAEEESLKVLDALERKNRLERQEQVGLR